ncbi:hypothetical protein [Saccharopolyspora spinosa]|uniref:hypothetical protein n=1 Tax=Saccharopolyspora spinosa TaxID=60894 RepID=UPI00165A0C56|nr:hypothetical protein [Saccharopolyspora spinosa]
MRNVYSPNVRCAQELVVDQLAAKMHQDRFAFRKRFAKEDRYQALLDILGEEGEWGRSLPAGVAQGVALAHEYRAVAGGPSARGQLGQRFLRAAVERPTRGGDISCRIPAAIQAARESWRSRRRWRRGLPVRESDRHDATSFPINHHEPLRFEPLPLEPSMPHSSWSPQSQCFPRPECSARSGRCPGRARCRGRRAHSAPGETSLRGRSP